MEAFRAVFWSFFGVRRGQDLERDARRLGPMSIILAGLAGAALLVTVLILLAWFITRQAG